MATIALKNTSENEFVDISSEEFRAYEFMVGAKIAMVEIKSPQYLAVSKSGGHRILDAEGISHYIPFGWIHLYWKADPHFVK